MSTKRRIGISQASIEAARRQLVQPVTCWERVLEPTKANPNVQVYKWVKTDRVPQFSDDDAEADEPLAPLPDEPELVEVDEEENENEEKEDALLTRETTQAPAGDSVEARQELEDAEPEGDGETEPQQLSMTLDPAPGQGASEDDALDASLKPLQPEGEGEGGGGMAMEGVALGGDAGGLGVGVDAGDASMDLAGEEVDLNALGPDGLGLESSHDLSQMDGGEALLGGGALMDDTDDPFSTENMPLPPPPEMPAETTTSPTMDKT